MEGNNALAEELVEVRAWEPLPDPGVELLPVWGLLLCKLQQRLLQLLLEDLHGRRIDDSLRQSVVAS